LSILSPAQFWVRNTDHNTMKGMLQDQNFNVSYDLKQVEVRSSTN
jgi:hypothetical protein